MLRLIRNLLEQIVNDIDSGNSNISQDDQQEVLSLIQKFTSKELSKLEAADYIGVSRATFDNYIKQGLLPKGKKRMGFKELCWYKNDLDNFLKRKNENVWKQLV